MRQTSHIIHFILTLLTGGLWIIIWVLCASSNNAYNQKILMRSMADPTYAKKLEDKEKTKTAMCLAFLALAGLIIYTEMKKAGMI